MKKINLIVLPCLFLGIFSCSNPPQTPVQQIAQETETILSFEPDSRLTALVDSFPVKGSVLVWDAIADQYYSNDFSRTSQAYLPASTFKIPNTLIGLETGYLADENHLFKWNGEKQPIKAWEQDLNLRQAFQASCVPCYRALARGVGQKEMQIWLDKLAFGKMDLTAENLDLFWLSGNSKITQLEQIDFLSRFYEKKLPIRDRNYEIMKKVMLVHQTDTYQLSAKSGTSLRGEKYLGWYVGFVEKGQQIYYFATNIEPVGTSDMGTLDKQRKEISLQALSLIIGEKISLE